MLLHPIFAGAWSWGEVISLLPPSIRPIVYDRRGTLADNIPSRNWSIDDHADDLEAIRKSAGVDKWDLAGVATGAMLALRYAVRYPQRVSSLILCNPVEKIEPDLMRPRAAALRQGGMNALLEETAENVFHGMPRDERYRLFREHFAQSDPTAYAWTIDALCEEGVPDDIDKIGSVPTLVIAGVRDKIISAKSGHGVADRIRGALYREIDAAHYPHCQAPAQFVDFVVDFMFPDSRKDALPEPSTGAGGRPAP